MTSSTARNWPSADSDLFSNWSAALQQMADDTGGHFYDSTGHDNLRNILAQLADLLFKYQYILEYISALAAAANGDLTIEAIVPQTVIGDDTKMIIPCP